MVEGTLPENDSVYRKYMRNGWRRLDDETEMLHVPGGMVLRSSTYEAGSSMVFVPCDAYDRRDWLNSQT